MTEKPIVDYFIIDGKVVNRGDEGFADLEAKYVKEIKFNDQEVEDTKEGGKK